MNISQLLTTIKMDLGIIGMKLPLENPDEAFMDVIKLKTLKTFSQFFPVIERVQYDLSKDLQITKSDYTESIYILPNKYPDREIVYVRSISPRNHFTGNGYISPAYDMALDSFYGLMLTQANADLVSVAAPPITFKFQAPNQLYIYNLATSWGLVDIDIAFEHANNLSTIPFTSWESFTELARADIKIFLYNLMKMYNDIDTAFGTIQLHIDDWSNAESDRKEIIEKWRDTYHLDKPNQFMVI
jgi:hypothetical protein